MLSEQAVKSFRAIYKLFTEVLPSFRGTILSGNIHKYLELEMPTETAMQVWQNQVKPRHIKSLSKKLLARRASESRLFSELKEWASAELSPPDIEELTYEGKVLYTLDRRHGWVQAARKMLINAYKDIICLVAFKYTLEELVTLAKNGDDKSLFRLVNLDKLFLRARFVGRRIGLAQGNEDYGFFRKLAGQLVKDGFRDHLDSSKRGMAVVLLWFLGGKEMTYGAFQSVVKEQTGYKWRYPESFVTFVNRLGLYKYPKRRHKKG